jgi:hypothetical protein
MDMIKEPRAVSDLEMAGDLAPQQLIAANASLNGRAGF